MPKCPTCTSIMPEMPIYSQFLDSCVQYIGVATIYSLHNIDLQLLINLFSAEKFQFVNLFNILFSFCV